VLLLLPIHGLRVYAVLGMAVVALHLLVAICLGPDIFADLKALAQAPLYVAGKIRMLPAILRMTRSRAAWVRTSRDDTPK